MASSYNGYEVIALYGDARLTTLEANGKWFAPHIGVLEGDVAFVMNKLANWLDAEVEPMDPKQSWAFYPKQVTGGSGWSCHASGTAFDYNAVKHPQGYKRTHGKSSWDGWQIAKIDAYLAGPLRGLVRWGEHYNAPTLDDGQHFEVMGKPLEMAGLVRDLKNPPVIVKKPDTPTTPATPDTEKEWYEMPLPEDAKADIKQIVIDMLREFNKQQGMELSTNALEAARNEAKRAVQEELRSFNETQGMELSAHALTRIAGEAK